VAEGYRRQSALAHLGLAARAVDAPREAGVRMWEQPPRDQLVLRGDAGRASWRDAVSGVLGVAPPTNPNTVHATRGASLLWLGPDEWLAVLPEGRGAGAAGRLEAALAGQHHAVVDVGHARGALGLSGPKARSVLMKGSSLDLHPRSFGPGHCAQSTLARCQVLLHQVDDAPAYDLWVGRSFLDYAFAWLEDAAREFGVTVAAG
jgi:sarcosine oxidase, subunit gamma